MTIPCFRVVSCMMHMFTTKWHWCLRCRTEQTCKKCKRLNLQNYEQHQICDESSVIHTDETDERNRKLHTKMCFVSFCELMALCAKMIECESEGANNLVPPASLLLYQHTSAAEEMGYWSRREHFMPWRSVFTVWLTVLQSCEAKGERKSLRGWADAFC